MTCIVGVVKDHRVWIGGDSASTRGLDVDIAIQSKVFKRGEFLYGFAGCWRTGQLLAHTFKEPPHRRESDIKYLVGAWTDAFRALVISKGISKTYKWGAEGTYLSVLLGYRGNLYQLEQDYAWLDSASNELAIGTGAPYALGALHATPRKPPGLRVRGALKAAANYNASVHGPFTVLSLQQ